MKLSSKMVLIFSVMMLLGLFLLSSYAANVSIQGANTFTQARFRNMSTSIQRDLEQDIDMMKMTLQELTENTTFMAALNQMVRDDSAEKKMALAASKAAVQQLLQSPLVDSFYRVTFYTRDGVFLTTNTDYHPRLASGSEEAKAEIGTLSWLESADQTLSPVILAPHEDILSPNSQVRVYGIAQQIKYHQNTIGYLEVANQYTDLTHILQFVDDTNVSVEAIFDDGQRLYESQPAVWIWPKTLDQGSFTTVKDDHSGTDRMVYYSWLDNLGVHLYISQDSAISESANANLRSSLFLRALYIMLPTLVTIFFVSYGLTRSISKLTKKVRQFPADSVLHQDEVSSTALLSTVTSPGDQETHELEQVFNLLMARLRDSASNELTLREGSLQARLSALQTQINPHFIYNTLNIISAKSMESGNYCVIEICHQFAQMLRYSTDTRSRNATMAEEIENVRNYLMLAKARYEDNLEFTIDVPENLHMITVPKLTLQPLVENAMTHGFKGKNVLRKLSVTGHIKEQFLILEIRDNGAGFSNEMLQNLRIRIQEIEEGKVSIETSGGQIGLINTCLRLHYYSKGKMRIALRNDHGAVITLVMPHSENDNQA